MPEGVEPGDHEVIATAEIDGRKITETEPVRILDREPTRDDDGSTDDDESLPNTGADLPLGLPIGIGTLLLAGAGTFVLGRRRP